MNSVNVPLVSVVIITFNHENYIRKAIDSILNQKTKEFDVEILVVDDGSTDQTVEILKRFTLDDNSPVKATLNPHRGIGAITSNLNSQLKQAAGKYIIVLAGDDLLLPGGILGQLMILEHSLHYQLVIGNGENIDTATGLSLGGAQDNRLTQMIENQDYKRIYKAICARVPRLLIQGYMFRSDFFRSIGFFDEDVIADDWALNIKIFQKLANSPSSVAFTSEVVFQHNIHESNTSRNRSDMFERILEVIIKYTPQPRKAFFLTTCVSRFLLSSILTRDWVSFRSILMTIRRTFL